MKKRLILVCVLVAVLLVGIIQVVGCAGNGEIDLSTLEGKIVFSSNRNDAEGWNLYTMNADGTDLMQITNNHLRNITPQWSPDGTRIA